jgi:hypothetical protein
VSRVRASKAILKVCFGIFFYCVNVGCVLTMLDVFLRSNYVLYRYV